jgi:hypothetical protein
MAQGVTVLERAFQLARSGLCGSVSEIRERLKAEGYSLDQPSSCLGLYRKLGEERRLTRYALTQRQNKRPHPECETGTA